ncbi:helix-turn-helix domain-containing protein [Verminephrobacter aporrectodeae]|uniref:helix-turn-helix domain-containing protein n=1 Tax=Verminephrobacter aporrectodeae TaxID=1110389 RepID=UPI00049639B3|nr:helix-turn-helix domain-containing protein [Verminephrobacter aporrectodeae]
MSKRPNHAKRHLEQTTWPLKQVAQRAGFGSVDSLQRSLRRHTGISADLYRQRFGRSAAAQPHSRPAAAGGSSGT